MIHPRSSDATMPWPRSHVGGCWLLLAVVTLCFTSGLKAQGQSAGSGDNSAVAAKVTIPDGAPLELRFVQGLWGPARRTCLWCDKSGEASRALIRVARCRSSKWAHYFFGRPEVRICPPANGPAAALPEGRCRTLQQRSVHPAGVRARAHTVRSIDDATTSPLCVSSPDR